MAAVGTRRASFFALLLALLLAAVGGVAPMWTRRPARGGALRSSRSAGARTSATAAAAREPAAARADRPSLLVVDDDASLRLAIASYLTDAGYHVRQAGCATEAFAICRGGPTSGPAEPPPSLLVLDVMMPGTDGLELLRQLRAGANDPEPAVARLATLPVVLLTARGFASDRIKGYRAGASAYITKPFEPEELSAVIQALLIADAAHARALRAQFEQGYHEGRGGGGGGGAATADEAATGWQPQPWQLAAASTEEGEEVAPVGEPRRLTEREREVLGFVSRGLMNKEIARDLGISNRMVEKYVSRLLAKSGTSTRTELARFAIAEGLAD